eukprot:CAMPEP_0176317624 /NCGR_PEP_ID=MMETSP0121_2-20121125/69348_1 /TAXON_ID=160619 /ORGANISM="Kryptoperidinium foliaceum, Strain CCMP 1326" /LENGTH=379 /DNA_ID=CAMNT_0017659879 /DNA_START=113 /DNA_END=1248 /DNA_ORIENTATION=+
MAPSSSAAAAARRNPLPHMSAVRAPSPPTPLPPPRRSMSCALLHGSHGEEAARGQGRRAAADEPRHHGRAAGCGRTGDRRRPSAAGRGAGGRVAQGELRQRDLEELAIHAEAVHHVASLVRRRRRGVGHEAAASGKAVGVALHVRRGDLAEGGEELHEVRLAPLRRHVEDVARGLAGRGRHLPGAPRRLAVEVPRLLPLHLAVEHVLVERLPGGAEVLGPMAADGDDARLRQAVQGLLHGALRRAAAAAAASAAPTPRPRPLPAAPTALLLAAAAPLLPAPAALLQRALPIQAWESRNIAELALDNDLVLDRKLALDARLVLDLALDLALDLLLEVLALHARLALDAGLLLDAVRRSAERVPQDPVQQVVGVAIPGIGP